MRASPQTPAQGETPSETRGGCVAKTPYLSTVGHQPLAQQSKASAKSLKTPLVNAIRTRDIRTLEFLLRFRLDLNVTHTNGMTPVMHAIAALNYAAVLRLYQPAGPDALFKVTRKRARRCAHALLAAGVDPNARDANGMTAAYYAAGAGHKSLLRDLVKYDADFSLTDDLDYDIADHADQLSGRLGRWVARQVDAAKCAAAQ